MPLREFKNLFRFDPTKVHRVGVERECFLQTEEGKIVPHSARVLKLYETKGVPKTVRTGFNFGSGETSDTRYLKVVPGEFSYELSACQLESRTGPCQIDALLQFLRKTDQRQRLLLGHFLLSPLHVEVGPASMPLDIYPDPTGRYQRITKNMPRKVLLAACRVIGTHVHVGMRDHEMALHVYNYVIRHWTELCEMGNGSFGERLAIYRQMAPDFEPKPYESWKHYYETALEKGFAEDPRKCWTLIRISVHGTIEFRMFGATDSVNRIVGWAKKCHALCQEALVDA